MKSRILKYNSFFKIGEIEFKVAGVLPVKKGLITSRTFIKCNNYFSSEITIKRALFITMQKYENLTKDEIINNLLKPDSTFLINKNDILKVKQKEFFVRNCEPETGRINHETNVSIENRDLLDIKEIKIAVIKENSPNFVNESERENYEEYITKEYFNPYFLSGIKKYVERGDIFKVDNLEMFILNCNPEQGFISNETFIKYKFGLDREKCLEKIGKFDNEYAHFVSNFEDILNNYPVSENENNTSRLNNLDQPRSHIEEIFERLNSLDRNLNSEIVEEDHILEIAISDLPIFKFEKSKSFQGNEQNDENLVKCIICMSNFEEEEQLKNLPCFHKFHSNCIDEWLRTSSAQCPICKFSIIEN